MHLPSFTIPSSHQSLYLSLDVLHAKAVSIAFIALLSFSRSAFFFLFLLLFLDCQPSLPVFFSPPPIPLQLSHATMPQPTMFGRSPSPPIVKVPGHYGDIMSKRDTTLSLPDGFTGFERMLLTANGNLQRLISAYFNKTVTVKILENQKVDLTEDDKAVSVLARFQREVDLLCNEKVFCNAKSQVLVKDPKVYDLIVNKGVGIGQIFRYLDKLPSFELHGLGRTSKTFWREYSLRIPGVDCRLLEVFPSSLSADSWLDLPVEDISWDVEMGEDDQLTWVNPNPEDK